MGAWFPSCVGLGQGLGEAGNAQPGPGTHQGHMGPTKLVADSVKRPAHKLPVHPICGAPNWPTGAVPCSLCAPTQPSPTTAGSLHVQMAGISLCRKSARCCGAGGKHMDVSISGHRPRRQTGGSQHPAWLGGTEGRYTVLRIHPGRE